MREGSTKEGAETKVLQQIGATNLKGEAITWWNSLREKDRIPTTIREFKERVRARFIEPMRATTTYDVLKKVKQGEKENIEAYIERMNLTAETAGIKEESLIMHTFLDNIAHREVRAKMQRWTRKRTMRGEKVDWKDVIAKTIQEDSLREEHTPKDEIKGGIAPIINQGYTPTPHTTFDGGKEKATGWQQPPQQPPQQQPQQQAPPQASTLPFWIDKNPWTQGPAPPFTMGQQPPTWMQMPQYGVNAGYGAQQPPSHMPPYMQQNPYMQPPQLPGFTQPPQMPGFMLPPYMGQQQHRPYQQPPQTGKFCKLHNSNTHSDAECYAQKVDQGGRGRGRGRGRGKGNPNHTPGGRNTGGCFCCQDPNHKIAECPRMAQANAMKQAEQQPMPQQQ